MGSIVRYRVSIYGSGIYKEAVLDEDKGLSIGTKKDCQIRFDKSKFFGDFKLSIEKVMTSILYTVVMAFL